MKNLYGFIFAVATLFLTLTIVNEISSPLINPAFQRAEILSGMSSILLMLISLISTNYNSQSRAKANIDGKQGIYIDHEINDNLKIELGWGSQMILTATPAVSLLVYYDNHVLIKMTLVSYF